MSELTWPNLPGIEIQVSRVPVFQTVRQSRANGRERTASRWATPKFRFSVQFNFLRTLTPDGLTNEVWKLLELFQAVRGAADDFWFPDPFDGSERKVRFDGDQLQLDRIFSGLWQSGRIDLVTTGDVRGGTAAPADLPLDSELA